MAAIIQIYNQTVDPSVSDDINSDYGIGSVWKNGISGKMFICLDNSVGAAVWENISKRGNAATVNPSATDDDTKDYSIGSIWVNTSATTVFVCTDNSTGSAGWVDVTTGGGGSGDPNYVGQDVAATPSATGLDALAMGPGATASNDYSIAVGTNTQTTRDYEVVVSCDNASSNKYNRGSIGFAKSTASNVPVSMGINLTTTEFGVNPSSVVSFDLNIAARDDTSGDCAVYHLKGAIKRDGAGTTALVGIVIREVIAEDDSSWDVTVDADNVNNTLEITVTGDATNVVQWAGQMLFVETIF